MAVVHSRQDHCDMTDDVLGPWGNIVRNGSAKKQWDQVLDRYGKPQPAKWSQVLVELQCTYHRRLIQSLPEPFPEQGEGTVEFYCHDCRYEGKEGLLKLVFEKTQVRSTFMCRKHGEQEVSKNIDEDITLRCPKCIESGNVRPPGIFVTLTPNEEDEDEDEDVSIPGDQFDAIIRRISEAKEKLEEERVTETDGDEEYIYIPTDQFDAITKNLSEVKEELEILRRNAELLG